MGAGEPPDPKAPTLDPAVWRDAVEKLLVLLSPMAPHITEELWERTGHTYSIHNQGLPEYDDELAADEVVTLIVQVNGRVRDKIEVAVDISEDDAKAVALASENVQRFTEGQQVVKVIYVPGRLVNVVAK